jgi:uncharacterized protein (TIGR02452 family)
MDREERIKVYGDTLNIVNDGYYTNKKGEKVDIENSPFKYYSYFQGGKDISKDAKKAIALNGTFDTVIKVVDDDTLKAAKDLIDEGFSPAVLNMASFASPGGGVLNGSAAQEENLFRRTDLCQYLYLFHDATIKSFPNKKGFKRKERYPLSLHHGGIYSVCVSVFKDTEKNNYELLDEPYLVDVITMAAIKNPNLGKDNKMTEKDINITKEKIRDILYLGILHGKDSLVLSAFGCGAYKNPPEEVAELFKEVINEEGLKGAFKKIVFAVLDDRNAHRVHNPNGNYEPFKNILER